MHPLRTAFAKLVTRLRCHPLSGGGLVVVFTLMLLSVPFRRYVVINTTPSLPRGVYVRTDDPPAVGRIVDFRVPKTVRGNRASEIDHIIKTVVAGPGDEVDTLDGKMRINGGVINGSMMLPVDSAGRAVPQWHDHRRLAVGEFFVLSTRISTSLDSRYYGPVAYLRSSQVAVAFGRGWVMQAGAQRRPASERSARDEDKLGNWED